MTDYQNHLPNLIEVFMHGNNKKIVKFKELTIDFGDFINPRETTLANPFQFVKSQMLKRKERLAIRRKPMQYQKLEQSMQEKLKKKSYNTEEQRDQVIMLEKCRSYFQLRRNDSGSTTPSHKIRHTTKNTIYQHKSRPMTSLSGRNSVFINKLKTVMNECKQEVAQQSETKQNIRLFTFYCHMMDKRLGGIKNNIEKRERMI